MNGARNSTGGTASRALGPALLAACTVLAAAMIGPRARAAAPSRVAADQSFVTAKCHVATASRRPLHWPDRATGCRTCHVHKGKRHSFAAVTSPPRRPQ